MNRKAVSRTMHLLAASRLSMADIADFFDVATSSDIQDMLESISKLRSQMEHSIPYFGGSRGLRAMEDRPSYNRLYNDIRKLIKQSDLPISDAGYLISRELQKRFPEIEQERLRFDAKTGLRRWLDRIVSQTDENAVIHAALEALGSRRGVKSSEWNLDY